MDYQSTYASIQLATQAACQQVKHALQDAGECVLLVPTYQETVRFKKLLAAEGAGFGVTVSMPDAWVLDLWEQWGDGRQMVCPVDRLLLLRKVLKAVADDSQADGLENFLHDTPGMLRLLADAAKGALPSLLAADSAGMGQGQAQVLACLHEYQALLDEHLLVEESFAAVQLVQKAKALGPVVVLDCRTSKALDGLLAAAQARYLFVDAQQPSAGAPGGATELEALCRALFHPDFNHPVIPTGQVRFAFPSGRYATKRLLADQIAQSVERMCSAGVACPRLVLAAKKPDQAFDQLARPLTERGISVSVESTTTFAKTDFGKAWTSLLTFMGMEGRENLGEGYLASGEASGYLQGNFSFMSTRQAQKMDKRLRSWRGQTIDDALTDMEAFAYEDRRDFMDDMIEGRLQDALQAQFDWVAGRSSWPESYRMQQLSAIQKAQVVHARAAELGLDDRVALEVLSSVVVPVKMACQAPNSRASVFISNLQTIGQSTEAGYDAVFLTDLNAADYPLKDDMRAVDLLLQQVGAYKDPQKIKRLRRWFAQAIGLAGREVVLHRCLHDADTQEARPTALLEELIDCYRSDPQNPDEVHKEYGLPPALLPYLHTLGEEEVAANLDATAGLRSPQMQALSVHETGYLLPQDAPKVVLPRVLAPDTQPVVCLSPSAVESYLECPYKWFAQRRLRLEGVDADFGPKAFGNFAHKVLEALHSQLAREGERRVTHANLLTAKELLLDQFERLLEEEKTSYRADALIPLDQAEKAQVAQLKRNLLDFLTWEAKLLPDFEPWKFELSFGQENPFEYAGVLMTGFIDRVDTDAFGHAAIIDYKGSVGSAYNFRTKDQLGWALPRKVQTAIYGQVIRRKFGLTPTACLYVSYQSAGAIAGLYDRLSLDAAHDLPGIKADLCSTQDMADDLDRCEEAIARHLESLLQGNIDPCPKDEKACAYCPVTVCQQRRG